MSLVRSGLEMTALTTRQRDILRILLDTDTPLGTAEIASQMNISARQVNYSLKGVKTWLAQQKIQLKVIPGVGVELVCSPEQTQRLQSEFGSNSNLQLILSAGQRQQLIALILLSSDEPLILSQLQQLARISRATILKDLDEVENWLDSWHMVLVRKPNFGIVVEAGELIRQQALAALMWGDIPFSEPLTEMSHTMGLHFLLESDAGLLPIVDYANDILHSWNTQRVIGQVAYAEEQLGGRFTDDAVLHLTLVFAILTARVQSAHHIAVEEETLNWLQTLPVWPVARMISKRLGWHPSGEWRDTDIAGISMQLLAAPRNETWPGDLARDQADTQLIDHLVEHICTAYDQPALCDDRTLRDGLVNHIVPACMRQRFHLWFPSALTDADLPKQFDLEHKVAGQLAVIVRNETGLELPDGELNNLALLLRAAFIRTRPHQLRRVIVVCPSGMATAQLLIARLGARFPRIGTLKVVSLRELNAEIAASAELILTTVPLSKSLTEKFKVIQVHPLLMPEDIDAITQFLT
jgi:mannitol operon transcriptional antiterminator